MKKIDVQVQALNTELLTMASMIEENISASINALFGNDLTQAKRIIEDDQLVNQKEKQIQEMCLQLLMRFQPVASDLRQISAVLKIITDLERIGDHAADIASITLQLANTNHTLSFDKIKKMADTTNVMLKSCIDAFLLKDLVLIDKVIDMDDIVDDLFTALKMDIVNNLYENKKDALEAVDLLLIAKYFERIGDHSCNIAKWVIFSINSTF